VRKAHQNYKGEKSLPKIIKERKACKNYTGEKSPQTVINERKARPKF
jgi:hypothetical protein